MKVDFCIRDQNIYACENCGETPSPYSIVYRDHKETRLCRACYYALAKIMHSASIEENEYVTSFAHVSEEKRNEIVSKAKLLKALLSGVYVPNPYNESNKASREEFINDLIKIKKVLDELLVITHQIEEEFEKEGR